LFPFVKVKLRVPLSNDAVIREDAVIAEVTYDDVAAFKLVIDVLKLALSVVYTS
jgi:hypothetical protein